MQGLTYFVQSALVDDHSVSLMQFCKAQLLVCYYLARVILTSTKIKKFTNFFLPLHI